MNMHALRAPLAAAGGVLALFFVAPAAHATDASVPPVKVEGNPKCADYGLTTVAKFDPVNSGTKNGVTLTKHDTYYVGWTSTVAIDWVIVKGGPNANIYKYATDTFDDDWLRAPTNGDNGKPYGLSHVEFCSDGANEPKPKPGITVAKSGPAAAYAGDQVTYTFNVTNTGGVKLTDVTVEDDRCAPLVRTGGSDSSFDPGDVWTYNCTTTITDSMGDALVNTVEACGKYGATKKCDTDTHTTEILKPAIALEKTGAASAKAGDTVTYEFAATNTGNVTLTNVVLTDTKCQATLARKAGETDTTFDKGDVWRYTCTAVVPAGVKQVENTAEVCGTAMKQGVEPRKVCAEDDHTFPVTPPAENPPKENPPKENPPAQNPPAQNPPASTPNQVPGASGDGGVLPVSVASGRAALRGPSGCVKKAFRARVRGRSIASVTFSVDGKKVKTFGGGKSAYSLKVRPGRYGFGRHKIVARVRFTEASGTKARTLPLTFRRCAQGTVGPRFTG
jgi:plastocyanin